MKKILLLLVLCSMLMSCSLAFWRKAKPEIVGYKKISLGIVNIDAYPEYSKKYTDQIAAHLSADRRIFYQFSKYIDSVVDTF